MKDSPNPDVHHHPLRAIVSTDRCIHSLSQSRRDGGKMLGSVRYNPIAKRFYFHPMHGVPYSDTQLWQLMCYVTTQNALGKDGLGSRSDPSNTKPDTTKET